MSRKYITFNETGYLSGAVTVSLDDIRSVTITAEANGKWIVTILYTDKSQHQLVLPNHDSALKSYTAILRDLGIEFSL